MTLLGALLLLAPVIGPDDSVAALQVSTRAFGGEVLLVVADLPGERGEEALRRALQEVRDLAELSDPDGSRADGLGRLNAGAGTGPVPVDGRLAELLGRALEFCRWSDGANGPLGGRLYRLWDATPAADAPLPEVLAPAVAAAGCDGLGIAAETGTALLESERRLDLRHLAPGFAADRAVAVLRQAGAANGLVTVAGVTRAFGAGPGGRGWRVPLPDFPGLAASLGTVRLEDESLAVAVAGATPYLDLRRGSAAQGVLATLVVSELGVDAQGLASTLFITGSRDGQLRLGELRPRPSVLWLLGSGGGTPLLVDYRWSAVSR